MILCSQAKLENDNKSQNVRRGLRARVEMGLWPCRPPTGYTKFKRMDQKCESVIDPERAPIIKQIFEKIGYDGWSGRKLHIWLRDELDFKTENGKHLSLGNLYRILENHFYYGRFEYPKEFKGNGMTAHMNQSLPKSYSSLFKSRLRVKYLNHVHNKKNLRLPK